MSRLLFSFFNFFVHSFFFVCPSMFRVTLPLSRRMAFYFLHQDPKMMASLESTSRFLARFCKKYDPPRDFDRSFDWSGIRFDEVIILKSQPADRSDDGQGTFTFYIVLHEALPPDGATSTKNIGCCLHPQKARSLKREGSDGWSVKSDDLFNLFL